MIDERDERGFAVYDYRTDVRNVVVTPEVRARFLRLEPGVTDVFHSHDAGHEVFLVLAGQAEFLIEGRRAVVGPGQMCFARAGQKHQVRVVGDEPMTLFLTVTPHLEPTHTFYDEAGRPLPPRYGYWTPAGHADQPVPDAIFPTLAARCSAATRALAAAVARQDEQQQVALANLNRALAAEDFASVKTAVDAIGEGMRQTYEHVQALTTAWNALALRTRLMEQG